VDFEWDDRKNLINEQKHGVSFEEARGLFESRVDYLEIFDSDHSEFEDRFIAIGRNGAPDAESRRSGLRADDE